MRALEGKVAVVTGGTGGLGRAVSMALAREGIACHVTYITDAERSSLEQDAAAHSYPHPIEFHRVDVTNAGAVARLYEDLDQSGRAIDFLVNLAGGFEMSPVEQTSVQAWERMLGLNATSVFLNCREAVARMKPRQAGRIITVSAKAALDTPGKMSVYVAAKAAVLAFTQSLARELKDEGITANCILPSVIDTPANRQAMPTSDFNRWVKPQQIAEAILFLLSDEAAAVTGAALPLYGRV
jgi:NAD(P)-dependent dehydrogenase (short-subunit alcohol dehydrogenase family)